LIITSFLDTDIYKYTMMLFAKYVHPNVMVEYAFKCRNKIDLLPYFDEIYNELKAACDLKYTDDEVDYLKTIDPRFEFLREYTTKPLLNFEALSLSNINGVLDIRVKGNWWEVILFEIIVLAITNEVYSRRIHDTHKDMKETLDKGIEVLDEKIKLLKNNPSVKLMEFGTRRRFSKDWQLYVISRLRETSNLLGTSNVLFAKELNLAPLGTMAHEAFQVLQGIVHPIQSQRVLLQEWHTFWQGRFALALTDIFPQKKFLKDFDKDIINLYTGVRHDSGSPYEWGESMINHYIKYGIDPKTKSLCFSDSLDIPKAILLANKFADRINVTFGIGTNLTNDMGAFHSALQVVMKIVNVNGMPVAKISNDSGKNMCEDPFYLHCLLHLIEEDVKNV